MPSNVPCTGGLSPLRGQATLPGAQPSATTWRAAFKCSSYIFRFVFAAATTKPLEPREISCLAFAIAELISAGVGVHAVERLVGETTGHVLTWVDTDAGRRHIEWHGANSRARSTAFAIAGAAAEIDAAIVSGASPAALVEAAAEGARTVGARVVLDATGDSETIRGLLADIDIVRGDASEIEALVESPIDSFDSAAEAARRLLAAGPKIAIVQAADQGDVVATAEGDELRLPHLDVDVVDPTGAGDAFVSAFTVLSCAGWPLAAAARLASAAAAHTASHLGGRPTFADEDDLADLLGEQPLLSSH
jgi:ribokinase